MLPFILSTSHPVQFVSFLLLLFTLSIINHSFIFAVLGVSSFKLLAVVAAPVAVVKTLISVIHGVVASVNITTLDQKERESAKKPEVIKKAE
jgi:uncharacterized protein involved in response to NO